MFLCLSLESFFLNNSVCVSIYRKDTFQPDRATQDSGEAHKSNFLHPVLYFYKNPPMGNVASCLFCCPSVHQLYRKTYFSFSMKLFHLFYSSLLLLPFHPVLLSFFSSPLFSNLVWSLSCLLITSRLISSLLISFYPVPSRPFLFSFFLLSPLRFLSLLF